MIGTSPSAVPSVLEVEHRTRYAYSSPVSASHHVAHLQPLTDTHQQLLDWSLQVEPAPAHARTSRDGFGNGRHHFELHAAHTRLVVCARSRVALRARHDGLQPDAAPAWDALAAGLRYVAGGRFEPALEFALPSPYVPRLPALAGFAAPSFLPGRPVAAVALELMHRIHEGFAYEARSTDVDTPLARVLEQRRGVCQDFAHLLAGCLRAFGVPARYVSGYLLTQPPGDGPPLLGADASHAWVQVWSPATPGVPGGEAGAWLDLDPTNDLVPGAGHVRVAVGRDYGDVTPLRGVIRGGGRHQLEVGVQTRLAGAPLAFAVAEESTPR